MSALRIAESIVLTPLRVGLGGLMLYAGLLKAQDTLLFANAIKAYQLIDPYTDAHAITTLAYTIPWAEMLCGLALILGAWARGAGLLLAAMLAAFAWGNWENWGGTCTCFGSSDPFCGAQPIGECHMFRNAGLGAAALLIAWRGAGLWGLDALLSRAKARRAARKTLAVASADAVDRAAASP